MFCVRLVHSAEIIWRLAAERIAKEAASKPVDLCGLSQLVVAGRGGAVSIVCARKMFFGK